MEKITFVIEDADGNVNTTKSVHAAQEALLKGLVVLEVRTIMTYTEHAKIVLKTIEQKTSF